MNAHWRARSSLLTTYSYFGVTPLVTAQNKKQKIKDWELAALGSGCGLHRPDGEEFHAFLQNPESMLAGQFA
jgi:hypothetical protein